MSLNNSPAIKMLHIYCDTKQNLLQFYFSIQYQDRALRIQTSELFFKYIRLNVFSKFIPTTTFNIIYIQYIITQSG